MKPARNIAAALGSSLWTAVLGLAIVPLVLHYLGSEAYGLIGFFGTVQTLFLVMDFGLAPTVNREVARQIASENIDGVRSILHTVAIIAWVMAGVIAAVMVCLSPAIAGYWLKSHSLPVLTLTRCLICMGFAIASRLPINLYQGALMGMQQVVAASALNVFMITLANVGAVLVLVFVSATPEAYFLWQAFAGVISALLMKHIVWRVVGRPKNLTFDFYLLKQLWTFSAGMLGLSISGLILSQLDKVVLSKAVPLDAFGRYILASVVANSLFLIVVPFYNVTFPRFSSFVAKGELVTLLSAYRTTLRLVACVLLSLAMVLIVFSKLLVSIWTQNAALATAIAPVVALLAFGTALNGILYIPHAVQLAFGSTRIPLAMNAVLLVTMVPVIIIGTIYLGIIGASAAWASLHVLYFFMSFYLTHRYLLKSYEGKWLLSDVGVPFFVSCLVGAFSFRLITIAKLSSKYEFALALLSGASALGVSLILSRDIRLMLRRFLNIQLSRVASGG